MTKIIAFEGIDGSGKTTHVQDLKRYLTLSNRSVVLYREPGGTPLGEQIREIVKSQILSNEARLFLFLAARAELCQRMYSDIIANRYDFILLDRYYYSTVAYQAKTLQQADFINSCNAYARMYRSVLIPHRVYWLDVEPSVAIKRLKMPDAMEEDSIPYLERIRSMYQMQFNASNWRKIDANRHKYDVFRAILDDMEKGFLGDN